MAQHDPEKSCTYAQAQEVQKWYNDNNLCGGVSKNPYSPWYPDSSVNPQPEDFSEWLIDTNNGLTGVNCKLIRDRIEKYPTETFGDTALQMTRDECKNVSST